MKNGTSSGLLTALILAGFALGAFADVRENPYQVIVDRNPFALKPIPPPVAPATNTTAEPPAPPVEIKLTGISTLLGPPKVFLEIVDTKTKKTERPRPLMVGEQESGVEIVAVDPEAGTVRVKNGDAETTLDFDKNGIKPTATASAAPTPLTPHGLVPPNPGAPGLPGAPRPVPTTPASRGIVVGNNATAAATPFSPTTMPARPLRVDTGGGAIVTGAGQSLQPPPGANAPHATLTREQAERIIEERRRAMQAQEQAGQVTPLRIMPPTRWTPSGGAPPVPGGQ